MDTFRTRWRDPLRARLARRARQLLLQHFSPGGAVMSADSMLLHARAAEIPTPSAALSPPRRYCQRPWRLAAGGNAAAHLPP